jgi:hypothetical protein
LGVARMLQHRLRAFAWWAGIMHKYPRGVVSVGVAGRILGVSKSRMNQLIEQGRLPLIDDMPGGKPTDRFIPIEALLGAPTPLDMGRSKGHAADKRSQAERRKARSSWETAQIPRPGEEKREEFSDET